MNCFIKIKITNHCQQGRRSTSTHLPLYEPLPGFENAKVADVPLNPPQFQTSTLSNGIKVVTVANKQPVSSIGLFINAGSRHESADNAGAAFFMKHMGFKVTLRFI